MMEPTKLRCVRCKVELQPKKLNLDYLGHRVTHEFLCCPICGEPYIPEDIAKGKMRQVEISLEDK